MTDNNKVDIEHFINLFQHSLSIPTLFKYVEILNLINENKLIIKSKSRHIQVRAVLNKCKKANIKIDYKLIDWNKKEDKTVKHIYDSIIKEDDLNKILSLCPKTNKGDELRLAIHISYHSGLRLSEVLNITQNNIRISSNIKLTFLGKCSKTRISYLPLYFKDLLCNFTSFTINIGYVENTFKRICEKLNLNYTFHSLRHSFATRILNNGININVLQQLLGHNSIKTTEIYLHMTKEMPYELKNIGY